MIALHKGTSNSLKFSHLSQLTGIEYEMMMMIMIMIMMMEDLQIKEKLLLRRLITSF